MTMIGADPDALDKFAARLRTAARELDEMCRTLDGAIRAVPWHGQDGKAFQHAWTTRHGKTIRTASTTLADNAAALERNANEQRDASAAKGGTGPASTRSESDGGSSRTYTEAMAGYFGKNLPTCGAQRSSTNVTPLDSDQGIILARFFIPDERALTSKIPLVPIFADDGPHGIKAIPGLGPDVLRGDGRGFSTDPQAGYRMALAWNTATGEVAFTVTPSEDGDGVLYPARPIDNKDGANRFNVHEDKPGSLSIDYSGLNSRTRGLSADGTVQLEVADGDIRVRLSGDDYPSFEAIQYTRDGTHDLGRDETGSHNEINTVFKSAGGLPREKEWLNGDEVDRGSPPLFDLRPSIGGVHGEAKGYLGTDRVGVTVGVKGHEADLSVNPKKIVGDLVKGLKSLPPPYLR